MVISPAVTAIAIPLGEELDGEMSRKDMYKAITKLRVSSGNTERECMLVEWEKGISPDPDFLNVCIRTYYKTELVAPVSTVFTFGENHLNVDGNSLYGKFVVLSGVSDAENRARMKAWRGTNFCDGYQSSDVLELINGEGMLEVPISHIVLNK
jgi:hypothetical protein